MSPLPAIASQSKLELEMELTLVPFAARSSARMGAPSVQSRPDGYRDWPASTQSAIFHPPAL